MNSGETSRLGASKVPAMRRIGDLLVHKSGIGHWGAFIVTHSVANLADAVEYLRWLNWVPGADYTTADKTIAVGIDLHNRIRAGATIGPIENDRSMWEVIR